MFSNNWPSIFEDIGWWWWWFFFLHIRQCIFSNFAATIRDVEGLIHFFKHPNPVRFKFSIKLYFTSIHNLGSSLRTPRSCKIWSTNSIFWLKYKKKALEILLLSIKNCPHMRTNSISPSNLSKFLYVKRIEHVSISLFFPLVTVFSSALPEETNCPTDSC